MHCRKRSEPVGLVVGEFVESLGEVDGDADGLTLGESDGLAVVGLCEGNADGPCVSEHAYILTSRIFPGKDFPK